MEKRPVHFVLETGSLSGGVRVVCELANRLVRRDWPVMIWSVQPKQTLGWFQLDSRVKWVSFYRTGTVEDYDGLTTVLEKQSGVKIATFWRTAFSVSEASQNGDGMYLVQDIETSYTSQPKMSERVIQSYQLPLIKITTSRWVESHLPDCGYIGIGVDNFYHRLEKVKRDGFPLACARRQALKGWAVLAEVARYLDKAGKPIQTFGIDAKLPLFASFHHHPKPDDKAVRQLYNQAGVFISTSVHEGLSLTQLEAMLCFCPVVTTLSDGNLEYVQDGENCLVGTTARELADHTLKVLKDRDLATHLSQSGYTTAQRYQWSDVIQRLEKFLNLE